MKTFAAILALPQATPQGGAASRILSNLPTDPASIATLLLLVAAVALVVWFGRPKGAKTKRTE
jgi:hypothetical protein